MLARLLVAILVLISSPQMLSEAASSYDLQPFEDEPSKITLLIPRTLMGKQKKTKLGFAWQDSSITIGTLQFPASRSMRDIYEKLTTRPGRRLSRNDYDEMGFVIEGADSDGSQFIVVLQKSAYPEDNDKSGVSITYDSRGGRPVQELAGDIANSFRYPGGIIDTETRPDAYLRDARKILAEVDKDPAKYKKVWPEFGVLVRKYQLRVGRSAASEAVQALF